MSTKNRFSLFGYPSSKDEVSKNWNSTEKDVTINNLTLNEIKNRKKKPTKKSVKCKSKTKVEEVPTLSRRCSRLLALDTEMVGIGESTLENMLARVSIIDFTGNVVYDTYVQPHETITDYRTQYSGITAKCLVGAPAYKEVQSRVAEIIKGKVILGHHISNDLRILMLQHPAKDIRDTSLYKPLRSTNIKKRPSLRNLAKVHLGREIQVDTHCSIEDARCCLEIYKKFQSKWEKNLACTMYKKKKSNNSSK